MKGFALMLAVWFIPIASVVAENDLQGICNGIKGLYNCKAKITVPTGAEAKMCPNKFFEIDPCKTKSTYKYPCPTWRKPGRMCNGWTCVPGTHETWIDVRCGIIIKTKNIDLCSAVRGALGNVGQQFFTKTKAMCSCLPEALKIFSTDIFTSVTEGTDLSAAATTLIGKVVRLQKCMVDNGFNIKDDKAGLMAGDLSTTGSYVVVTAVEIDLAVYGDLAAAISPCFVGPCNLDLIRSFFTEYLTKSKELMSDAIVKVLDEWFNIFIIIEQKVDGLTEAITILLGHLETLPEKVKAIEDRICANDTCLGPVIASYLQKLSEAIQSAKAFQTIYDAIGDVVQDVENMRKLVEATIKVAESIPSLDDLLEMIKEGKLQDLSSILEAIQISKELPKLAKSLKNDIITVIQFITTLDSQRNHVAALISDILSTSWESFPIEFTTDSSGNVRAGLQEIQTLIQTEINEPLINITSVLQDIEQSLNRLPFRNGNFEVKSGVASYKRWSTVQMELPCTRQKRKNYEIAGFRGNFDYPEFYSCPYGPKRIPWPNHHIPYIKFKVS